jgi:hypothetical protein
MIERAGIELTASLYGAALDPVEGALDVPSGPGLGLEPDPDVLRECAAPGR